MMLSTLLPSCPSSAPAQALLPTPTRTPVIASATPKRSSAMAIEMQDGEGSIRRGLVEGVLFTAPYGSSLTAENATLLGRALARERERHPGAFAVGATIVRAFHNKGKAPARSEEAIAEVRALSATHHAALPLVALVHRAGAVCQSDVMQVCDVRPAEKSAVVRVRSGESRVVYFVPVLCCACPRSLHGNFSKPWSFFTSVPPLSLPCLPPSAVPPTAPDLPTAPLTIEANPDTAPQPDLDPDLPRVIAAPTPSPAPKSSSSSSSSAAVTVTVTATATAIGSGKVLARQLGSVADSIDRFLSAPPSYLSADEMKQMAKLARRISARRDALLECSLAPRKRRRGKAKSDADAAANRARAAAMAAAASEVLSADDNPDVDLAAEDDVLDATETTRPPPVHPITVDADDHGQDESPRKKSRTAPPQVFPRQTAQPSPAPAHPPPLEPPPLPAPALEPPPPPATALPLPPPPLHGDDATHEQRTASPPEDTLGSSIGAWGGATLPAVDFLGEPDPDLFPSLFA